MRPFLDAIRGASLESAARFGEPMPPSFSLEKVARFAVTIAFAASLGALSGCGGGKDAAEEHRKLSLRLEHDPPGSVPADHEVELHARIKSSLEPHRVEAWVRLDEDGDIRKIPLHLDASGDATGSLPARRRGTTLRYALEARDAAGLVVSLPRGAADGRAYEVRYEGRSSAILAGLSGLATICGVLLYLGAGAASAQHLRGRMSVGPAGLLGGLGILTLIAGLFFLGGIHAFQVSGTPWPSKPVLFALSRADLALVTLLWIAVLYFGRETLLDDVPDGGPRRERAISVAGVLAAALIVVLAIF